MFQQRNNRTVSMAVLFGFVSELFSLTLFVVFFVVDFFLFVWFERAAQVSFRRGGGTASQQNLLVMRRRGYTTVKRTLKRYLLSPSLCLCVHPIPIHWQFWCEKPTTNMTSYHYYCYYSSY